VNDGFDLPASADCSYSLPHYRHVLARAREHHWLPLVRDVARGVPDRPLLLIRHDVDITPWSALRMAELEHSVGVHTTYYWRLHAPFYNLLDGAVLDAVRAIAAMGHEVGLHHEPGFFLERGRDPVAGIRDDIRTFEALVGFRTHTIAQHQPAAGPVLGEISPEHPCAYQPALVRDMPYFGDSGFHWREGCICTRFDLRRLHVLIHPHSWVRDGRPWQDVLRAHASDLAARLAGEMEAYVAHVADYLQRRGELDHARARRYRS
jgi:hypothetical protein